MKKCFNGYLLALCFFVINGGSLAQKSLPFVPESTRECMSSCIDKGHTFCRKIGGSVGICCEAEKCGNLNTCSAVNRSRGARYLQCFSEDFCGERKHTAS